MQSVVGVFLTVECALFNSFRTYFWLESGMTSLALSRTSISTSLICLRDSRWRSVLYWAVFEFHFPVFIAVWKAWHFSALVPIFIEPHTVPTVWALIICRSQCISPHLCRTLKTLREHLLCCVLSGVHWTSGMYSMTFSLIVINLGFSRPQMFSWNFLKDSQKCFVVRPDLECW